MGLRVLLTLFVLLSACLAQASEPLFGPEFTFTNDELQAEHEAFQRPDRATPIPMGPSPRLAALRAAVQEIVAQCARTRRCALAEDPRPMEHRTSFRFDYADGFYFNVTLDPGVLEVQAKPLTAAGWAQAQERLQADLFDCMERVGLKPHSVAGGGHINIGLRSAFNNDVHLLRNFIVDYMNHPELAHVFGEQWANGPHLVSLGTERKQAFKAVIDRFDAARGEGWNIESLVTAIEKEVYTKSTHFMHFPEKYHALNLNTAREALADRNERRLELRAQAAQRSAADWVAQVTLFAKRIEWLREKTRNGERLAVEIPKNIHNAKERAAAYTKRFLAYVTEMGQNWQKYVPFMRLPGCELLLRKP